MIEEMATDQHNVQLAEDLHGHECMLQDKRTVSDRG